MTTLPQLEPHHREHLRTSGLTDETIEMYRLRSVVDPKEVGRILRWEKGAAALGSCIAFPFFDPKTDALIGERLRPDKPRLRRDGRKADAPARPVKYESARDSSTLTMFGMRALRCGGYRDSARVLVWLEGEKKLMLLDQLGFVAVGLTGVDCAHDLALRSKGPDGRRSGPFKLAPIILDNVSIAGRSHVILFDSDASEKPAVLRAARNLGRMLRDAGADDVRFATPPSSLEGVTP